MSSLETGGVFTCENTSKGSIGPHKSLFPSYKLVSRKNGDHEWLIMINAFIFIWKFQKNHAANREESFNINHILECNYYTVLHFTLINVF